MLVWKDVLEPGTYHTPNGVLNVTRADLAALYERGKRMLAKGLQIPVPLAHQDSAKPVSRQDALANKVRNNTGWTMDYRMSGDTFQAQLDILDEDVAKKVGTTIRYISPEIEPFRDADGENFGPVVTHVALTPRPVFHRQKPFESAKAFADVAAKMSFRFSFADKEKKPVKKDAPEEETPDETPADDAPPDTTPDADTSPAEANLGEVIGLLKELFHLELPNDTDAKKFVTHLRVALIACRGAGHSIDGKDEDPNAPAGDAPGAQGNTTPQEEQPMGGYAMDFESAENPYKKIANDLARKSRTARIDAALATGRIGPDKAKTLKTKLDSFQLSLDKSTPLIDELLEFVESLPEGAVWPGNKKKQLSHDVVEHEAGDDNTKLQEAAGDELASRAMTRAKDKALRQ